MRRKDNVMDVVPLERNKTWETSAQGTGKNVFQLFKYLKLLEREEESYLGGRNIFYIIKLP